MANKKVSYVKPTEPPFIRRLKERIGYIEGPNVETKREELPKDLSEEDLREEEKPVVVVLKPGDLTKEEADEFLTKKQTDDAVQNDRIIFKKPEKRTNEIVNTSQSSKKKKTLASFDQKTSRFEKKVTQNSSLLSFTDEDDQ